MLGIARPDSSSDVAAEVLRATGFSLAWSLIQRATAGISSAIGPGNWAMAEPLRWGRRSARMAAAMNCSSRVQGTPYSRTADGRAVLRSSVREFLCSEAMHSLGIPTTRALSLVATGEHVVRDMFYDGNPRPETGAIVCRVSPSFVRFGNFEILAAQNELDVLKRLADYVIREHFPELGAPSPSALPSGPSGVYASWFEEICRRTATLVSRTGCGLVLSMA